MRSEKDTSNQDCDKLGHTIESVDNWLCTRCNRHITLMEMVESCQKQMRFKELLS